MDRSLALGVARALRGFALPQRSDEFDVLLARLEAAELALRAPPAVKRLASRSGRRRPWARRRADNRSFIWVRQRRVARRSLQRTPAAKMAAAARCQATLVRLATV